MSVTPLGVMFQATVTPPGQQLHPICADWCLSLLICSSLPLASLSCRAIVGFVEIWFHSCITRPRKVRLPGANTVAWPELSVLDFR